MLAPRDLQRIADVCTSIGNEVADPSGFVPIRKLLERFGVTLVLRPLLVEGMLATIPGAGSALSRTRWAVLVDKETYGVEEKEIALENQDRPLPSRLRNTISHELVHSLAFRPSDFGLQLERLAASDEKISELVEDVERETERLSPLLLLPERSIVHLLETKDSAASPSELAHLASRMGISRQILVGRLRLFKAKGSHLTAPWLRNVAIGLGEWSHNGQSVVRKWPLFANFDRNIIPSFLHRVVRQDRLPASTVMADENFAMCGGDFNTVSSTVDAGLVDVPDVERMAVILAVENAPKKPGAEFIFVVRTKRQEDR